MHYSLSILFVLFEKFFHFLKYFWSILFYCNYHDLLYIRLSIDFFKNIVLDNSKITLRFLPLLL